MKKFFMAVIALMMTVSVSAQFYIYLNNGEVLKADSISMVEPSPSSNPLIGTWVVDLQDGNVARSYTEFGKDGVVTCYSLKESLAKYEDSYIQVLQETSWGEDRAMKYTFDYPTQSLWISDVKVGAIEKVSNDEFVLTKSYDYIRSGTYRRVKGFKTVEDISGIEETSDYYYDGREPVFDFDKSTINGRHYDNTTKFCWKYTIKTTTLGITASTTEYMWGTEFSVVAACEESMYVIAHTGDSRGSYSYVMVTGTDEDACTQLSEGANN